MVRKANLLPLMLTINPAMADPLPPGRNPLEAELQMLAFVFIFNLLVNSAIVAAVLKVMRQNLGRALLPAVLLITVGGLFIDSFALSLSHGAILALFLVSFILMAAYTAFILKLVKKSDLRTATLTGIAAGILSNPGFFAFVGHWI